MIYYYANVTMTQASREPNDNKKLPLIYDIKHDNVLMYHNVSNGKSVIECYYLFIILPLVCATYYPFSDGRIHSRQSFVFWQHFNRF